MHKLTVVHDDPIHRHAERDVEHAGMSPMDPPEAYAPPAAQAVDPAEFHPYLRRLTAEHHDLAGALDALEGVLQAAKSGGFDEDADRGLMRFLEVFDRDFIPHSLEEEVTLFPLLRQRLLADGEHSSGPTPTTPVDVMRQEHQRAVQLATVALNLIRLGPTLPDARSAQIVVNAGLHAVENLVELLRLHIFREDHIVFASAHRLLSPAELDAFPPRRPTS